MGGCCAPGLGAPRGGVWCFLQRLDSLDVSLGKLWEMVRDGQSWRVAVPGVLELDTTEPGTAA